MNEPLTDTQRITALEKQVRKLTERITALEAAPDSAARNFPPKWEVVEDDSVYTGIGESRFTDQFVRFHYSFLTQKTHMMSEYGTISLDAGELRALIGAALAVLARMEAQESHEN